MINNKESNQPIKTLTIVFDLPIYVRQIAQWRGAFVEMAGWEDELFHNHNNTGGNYHYRYPLIQYRIFRGKASIFAINEGVQALQKVLAANDWIVKWHGKNRTLQVADLRVNEHYLRMTKISKQYKLHNWLALNEEGYEEWLQCENAVERIYLLQRKLENHLIGCFKGLAWHWPERIKAIIEFPNHCYSVNYHDTKLMAFDIDFRVNVLLPEGIAIGKGVSHGFGWIMPKRTNSDQPIATKRHAAAKIHHRD